MSYSSCKFLQHSFLIFWICIIRIANQADFFCNSNKEKSYAHQMTKNMFWFLAQYDIVTQIGD
jgi:hypothetical protein